MDIRNFFKNADSSKAQQSVSTPADLESAPALSACSSASHSVSSITASIRDLGLKYQGPMQPKLDRYPSSQQGQQNRAFNSSWFFDFPFIEYSVGLDAVFCFPCRIFSSGTGYSEDGFRVTGVRNWKKFREKTAAHSATDEHATYIGDSLSPSSI
jgi:hypothetical protein